MPRGAVLPTGAANADLLGGETIMRMDILLPPAQPPGKPPHSPPDRARSVGLDGSPSTGLEVDSPTGSSRVHSSFQEGQTPGSMKLARGRQIGSPKEGALTPPHYNMTMSEVSENSPGAMLNLEGMSPFASQSGNGKPTMIETGSTGMLSPLQSGASGMLSPQRSTTSAGLTTPRAAAATSPFLSSGMSPQCGMSSQTQGVSPRSASPGLRVSPMLAMPLQLAASPQWGVSPSGAPSPRGGMSPPRGRLPAGLVGSPGPARYPAGAASSEQRAASPHLLSGIVRASSIQQPQDTGNSPQRRSFVAPMPTGASLGTPRSMSARSQGATSRSAEGDLVMTSPRHRTTPQPASPSSHISAPGISPMTTPQLTPVPEADPAAVVAPVDPAAATAPAAASASAVGTPPASEETTPGHPLDHRLWEAEQLLNQHIAEVRARFDRNVRTPLHQQISTIRDHHTRAVDNAWHVDQKLGKHAVDVHGNFNDALKYTGLDQGLNHGGTLVAQKLDRHISRHISVTSEHIEKHPLFHSPEAEKADMERRERKRAANAQLQRAREHAHLLEEEHWRVDAEMQHAKEELKRCHDEEHHQDHVGLQLWKKAEENVFKPLFSYAHDIDQRAARTLHSARESFDKSLERTGFHNGLNEGVTAMVQHFEHVLARSLSPRRSKPAARRE
mmetsp:Transcript_79076/g.144346  ORF Transcript_79076/g.144346 Transcript_79076/m.144346 type:complete len:671 (-) Transcript_79076:33-2045(-)